MWPVQQGYMRFSKVIYTITWIDSRDTCVSKKGRDFIVCLSGFYWSPTFLLTTEFPDLIQQIFCGIFQDLILKNLMKINDVTFVFICQVIELCFQFSNPIWGKIGWVGGKIWQTFKITIQLFSSGKTNAKLGANLASRCLWLILTLLLTSNDGRIWLFALPSLYFQFVWSL